MSNLLPSKAKVTLFLSKCNIYIFNNDKFVLQAFEKLKTESPDTSKVFSNSDAALMDIILKSFNEHFSKEVVNSFLNLINSIKEDIESNNKSTP